MRCKGCDVQLNDWESTNQNIDSNLYEDLCSKCLRITNQDLYELEIDDDQDEINYVSLPKDE